MSGWRWPAEWEPRSAVWTAWPADPALWGDALDAVRSECVGLARALEHEPEALHVLASGAEAVASARAQLAPHGARIWPAEYGDVWLRDTGPFFGIDATGHVAARAFAFNGWGGKYRLPGDAGVAAALASCAGVPLERRDWVLEGGAVETDGQGTVLTTRECLLNPNRNPGLDAAEVEARLVADLGVQSILWLTHGLAHDHTDGHIDNVARWIAPGVVLCQHPSGADDPQRERLEAVRGELQAMRTADGRSLDLHSIPSPGRVLSADGAVLPASHLNLLILSQCVLVPVYGTASEAEALAALETVLRPRTVRPLPAKALLEGGGAWHCVTQTVPNVQI